MRRVIRIPAWYLLLVAVLGILSKCERLRDLERFARRHHGVLTETLGIELKRPPSDCAFRYFFLQVDVASICASIRDWTLAHIHCVATGLALFRRPQVAAIMEPQLSKTPVFGRSESLKR